MVATRNPLLDRLHTGHPRARHLVWSVPQRLQPGADRMAWVMAFDESGTVVHDFQGPVPGFFMCTGVREQDGRVWMGSLEATSVAWFEVGR